MGCSVGGYTSIAGEMSCPPQSICSEVSIHYIFIHNRIYSCARHGMRFMAACHVLNSFLVIAVRHPPTTDRYSGLNRLRTSLHRPRPAILQLRFFPGPVFVFHSSVLSTPATKCTFGGQVDVVNVIMGNCIVQNEHIVPCSASESVIFRRKLHVNDSIGWWRTNLNLITFNAAKDCTSSASSVLQCNCWGLTWLLAGGRVTCQSRLFFTLQCIDRDKGMLTQVGAQSVRRVGRLVGRLVLSFARSLTRPPSQEANAKKGALTPT